MKSQDREKDYSSIIFLPFILLLSCLLIACSAPKGLPGVWQADRQECLYKDTSGIFRNYFTEGRRYTLELKNNNQVSLIYPNLKVSADLFVDRAKQEGKEELQCDVVFDGTYSYSALGSLEFNFAHDETGAYRIRRGENCDTNFKIEFKQMPTQSPYKGDPTVSVETVNAENLYLAFPGFPKCKSDKMITVFKRK